jgi:predicted branched-subunit amino acid permease
MVQAGLTTAQSVGMTLLVFAGSAQLAALPLIVAQAPVWVILVTACVVNLRFVIFSAGLHAYFRTLPFGRRLLLGYLTGDVSFAVFVARHLARRGDVAPATPRATSFPRSLAGREAFFLGMAAPTWLGWQAASLTGIVLAGQIPPEWGLSFAGIVALIALTLPMIVGTPATAGAAVAAVVGILTVGWPLKLGLLAAVVVGMGVALLVDTRTAGTDGSTSRGAG